MNYRRTKCKWTKEEIEKVFNSELEHISAHFDSKQAIIIHNNNLSNNEQKVFLRRRQGNNKKPKQMPKILIKTLQNKDLG